MSPATRVTLFLSLVLTIYLLRSSQSSPGTMLRRVLQDQTKKLTEQFCSDVGNALSISESQISRADKYRYKVQKLKEEKSLSNLIQRGDPRNVFLKEYGRSFIPLLVPWVVCFAVSLIVFLFFILNWCCMTCCRRCACRPCLPPKTNRHSRCYGFFSIIFMALTVGAGVAGLIYSSGIQQEANASICSMLKLAQNIRDGSPNNNFVGLKPAINQVDMTVQGIREALRELSQLSASLANINLGLPQANALLDEVRGFATGVEQEGNKIVSDVEAQQPNFQRVENGLDAGLRSFEEKKDSVTSGIRGIKGVFLGIFLANVVVGGLTLFVLFLICGGARSFVKVGNLLCFLLGIVVLVTWALSPVLFGGSIIVLESSNVGNGVVNNVAYFNQIFDKLNTILQMNSKDYEQTRDVLFTCLHGSGDLAAEYNLNGKAAAFTRIFGEINKNAERLNTVTLPQSVQNLNGTLTRVYTTLTNENTGLLRNTNCTFVRQNVQDILNVTCGHIGVTLFQVAIIVLVLAFVGFWATSCLFCLGKRANRGRSKEESMRKYMEP